MWHKRLERLDVRLRAEDFWRVSDAALVLDKKETTVRRMVDQGKIYATRLGGTLYVHVPSLKKYLTEEVRKHLT